MKCDMAGAAAVVAGDARDRPARPAGQGHHVRADGREHGVRHARSAPATCSRCTAARPSRSPTPTPRAGWSWPTRSSVAAEERARRDHRRRHPHRPHASSRSATRSAGVMGTDDDGRRRARPPAGAAGEQHVADADPGGDDGARSTSVEDRRPAPARLGPLGRRPVRRGVPARVRRRPAVGPPRHRRPGVQHRRPLRPRARRARTGFGVATLVEYVAALAAPTGPGRRDSTPGRGSAPRSCRPSCARL